MCLHTADGFSDFSKELIGIWDQSTCNGQGICLHIESAKFERQLIIQGIRKDNNKY